MQADQTVISLRPGGGGGLRGTRFLLPRFDSSSSSSSSFFSYDAQSLRLAPTLKSGELQFEDRDHVRYTRDQLLQLREVATIPEDILKIKQEIGAELVGKDQTWVHSDANLQPQSQSRYSESANRDWRGRSAQLPASGEERPWEAIRDNKEYSNQFESRPQELNNGQYIQGNPNQNVREEAGTAASTHKSTPPSQPSQAKNPGQLVPFSPVSQVNHFAISSPIPKPNYERPTLGQPSYSFALASLAPRAITPYSVDDPFAPLQSQRSYQQPRRKRSPYVKKPFLQHIFYIEPHLAHIKDPLTLAMEVLPPNWHFLPKHPSKSIKFYKSILTQEKSARIKNIQSKEDPSVVLYHKFIITRFTSCKEWGQHPSLLRTFQINEGPVIQYSYYDYIDAFEKVLFYQNKNFDHSWFLMFDKNFNSQIPTWFFKWWEMFGSVPQIFPEPLQDALRYFASRFQVNNHNSQFPTILHMTAKYKIHWISMWSYAIGSNLLNREFSVKWWDSLKIDSVISQINKDFPPPVHRPIIQKTRSQSSLEFVSVAGKSSKEIKDLAKQLLLQASQLEEEEKVSPTSLEASTSHYPFDPFQDSQDPYKGHNLDSA